jgi:hypothetical protein
MVPSWRTEIKINSPRIARIDTDKIQALTVRDNP